MIAKLYTFKWDNMMSVEHKVTKNGKFAANKDDALKQGALDKFDVYFRKANGALIDSELGSLDVIKVSPIGTILKADNFVFDVSGARNNWAKAQLIDGVVDVMRKETESCDCPQAFEIRFRIGNFIITENER